VDALHRRVIRRIRETAKQRGIPLSQLSDRAAVARSHFFSVLAGEKSPTLRWLGKIAEALHVDAQELLVRRRVRERSVPAGGWTAGTRE
jgi:transcriptional regulator with XRE-family HTH domain